MVLKKSLLPLLELSDDEDAFSTKGSNGANGGPRIKILRFFRA